MKTKGSKAKAIIVALGIVLLFLGIQGVIGAAGAAGASYYHFAQTGEAFKDEAEYMDYISEFLTILQFVGEIACIVVFGLWYYFGSVRKDKMNGTYESGLKKVANAKTIAFLACTALGFYGFDLIVSNVTAKLVPGSSELFGKIMGLISGGNQVIAVLTIAIMAPFAEELAFRAVMMKSSKKAFEMAGCIVLTALMFGLMHMNPLQSLYALPIGVALGFVAYKFNSVVPAIIIHAINNTIAIVIPSILGRAVSTIEGAIMFVVFVALAFVLYKKLNVKTKEVEATEEVTA